MRLALRRRNRTTRDHGDRPRPMYVACVDLPPSVRRRLDDISWPPSRRPAITDAAAGDALDVTSLRWAEVIVLGVADSDARGPAIIADIVAAVPSARVVVVGESTRWFDEAFELGAHVWIDAAADDRTVQLAVTGEV